ncbi:MAG TPA: restriction endonuclease subunit S [Candidatus Cloacimonadota bacterium]|nr:restriction endonuclease subunit S [Candidatus Cloacimonadota bacterium]
MKSYEKYIDTHIQWLHDIPSHWEIIRNKDFISEKREKSIDGKEDLLSVSQYSGIKPKGTSDGNKIGMSRAESLVGYKVVKNDDFVMNIMLAWNGSQAVSRYNGVVSPAYCVFQIADRYNPWFYHYLFRTEIYKAIFKRNSTGVIESRLRLYPNKFFSLFSLCPPRSEQDQIVKFLDSKIYKINKFIKAKKREIELLNEQKQTEINRAVTKGLNPNATIKHSGIEWLGEIPEHWKLKRIKNVLVELEERSIQGDEEPLSMSQKYGIIKSSELSIPNSASTYVGGKIAHKNNLVFNKLKAHLGVFSVSKYEGVVSPDYAVYSVIHQDSVEFLEKLFKTKEYIQQFIRHSRGIAPGLRRLYTFDLFNIKIAIPELSEQLSIIDHISNLEAKISFAIDRIESQIKLVQEYKSSLISDTVTGRVDVRNIKIDHGFELNQPALIEEDVEEEQSIDEQ